MRLTAAAETLSSRPAAAKLPLRAAASNALMPLRKSSRRMRSLNPQENLCKGKITQFARAVQARHISLTEIRSNDAVDDCRAGPADGRDSFPVGPVRHGRRV